MTKHIELKRFNQGTALTTGTLALPPLVIEGLAEFNGSFDRLCLKAGTAAIEAMLAADAEQFCGKRYQRHADRQGYRWGMIGSEVGWHGGQAAIRRPRVRERGGAEVELPSWRAISGARPTSATISATISSPTSLRVCVTALSTAGLGTTWAPTKIRDIAANDQI
jgi:hypothetical protein